MLIHTRYLVNSFQVTVRVPPEILTKICSHLSTEEDVFSASQVCRHWRGVLISSPSLWTRFSCRHVRRTISSLERCKSVSIQLKFDPQSSIVALEHVLLRGNKIASLTIHHDVDRMPPLHRLSALSTPSLERLHIYSSGTREQEGEEWRTNGIWHDFPSLRELFVCRFPVPIGRFAAPNLIHLALENVGEEQEITMQRTLDMLCGCPLLETILIINDRARPQGTTPNQSPVSLPNLRSIELGVHEVRSGLITHLRFPATVAAGFRSLEGSDVAGNDIPPSVMTSSKHVLRGIEIPTVILAVAAPRLDGHLRSLVRFEGVDGSLEITFQCWYLGGVSVLFCDNGVLFSFAPRLDTVRELQIAECYIFNLLDTNPLMEAMPNLTSICFFHCIYDEYSDTYGSFGFRLLRGSSLPFPHLERLTVLEPGPGLIKVGYGRKRCGVPLKTVVIGPEPSLYTPEQIMELRESVEDVRVEIPPDISEWSVGNRVLDTWSETGIPGPVSAKRNLIFIRLTLFRRIL